MRFEPHLEREDVNVAPGNPLRELAFVGSVVAVGAALALLVISEVADRLAGELPVATEVAMFQGLGEQIAAATEDTDPRAAHVEAVFARVVAQWTNAPYPFRVGVLDSDTPNAVALPGGWVLVTRGLLDVIASDNALFFVLAHEIGHFVGRHHLRRLGRALATGLLVSLATGPVGPGTGVVELVERLTSSGYSRDDERYADGVGMELTLREFGHLGGAFDFFRAMGQGEGGLGARLQAYLGTHPVSAERVADLEAEARRRDVALDAAPAPVPW